jgi:hypothetical protein
MALWDQVCDVGWGPRSLVGGPYGVITTIAQPVWVALAHPQVTPGGARAELGLAPAQALAGRDPVATGQGSRSHDEGLAGLLQDWRELKLEREV